jgi:FdhE protein
VGGNSIDVLRQTRPEWMPWLAVVDEAIRDIGAPSWETPMPANPRGLEAAGPLLAGATIAPDAGAVRGLLQRLLHLASRCGTSSMATLRAMSSRDLDHGRLFRASIVQDGRSIAAVAHDCDVDADALHAVVALLCIPFVQGCRRQWASLVSPGWTEGHCPVCASWPAFAEVRGIDRHRYLRCGRCGADWHGEVLRCSFCRNLDHEQMTTLVPEQQGTRGVIEACRRCRSYIKAFTKLQGTPPVAVILEDLASVDLDIAAVEQGYARPEGAACEFDVSVEVKPDGRRFLACNT